MSDPALGLLCIVAALLTLWALVAWLVADVGDF